MSMKVEAGQIWERHDGSQFTIDHLTTCGYAVYWLSSGSRPQFRSVRVDRLRKHYKLLYTPA